MTLNDLKTLGLAALPSVSVDRLPGLPSGAGVYIAYEGDQVFYVGRSVAMKTRWYGHPYKQQLRAIPNARVAWIETPANAELIRTEEAVMKLLKPLWNIRTDGGGFIRPGLSLSYAESPFYGWDGDFATAPCINPSKQPCDTSSRCAGCYVRERALREREPPPSASGDW